MTNEINTTVADTSSAESSHEAPELEPINQLAVVVEQSGLELESAQSLKLAFAPLFDQAEEWRRRVATIKVTDISQVREMRLAREARLALKEIRVKADKMRKALKEDSLRRGRAIDGIYNVLAFLITPLEKSLLEQEEFAERKEEERKARLKIEREQALAPYGVDTSFYQLGEMPDDTFNQLLSNTRIAHEAMREAAIRAEQERIAREKAEAEERERIRLENERLKREAAEREEAARIAEAELKAERERVAKEQAEAAAKAAREKKAIEAKAREAAEKARKEREAIEARAKAEREVLEAKAREAAEKARKEREAIEARAKAEREVLEAKAREAEAAQKKAEREAQEVRDSEARRIEAEAEAKRRAALAPEREKILAFAKTVRGLDTPFRIMSEVDEFVVRIEHIAEQLVEQS